MGITAKIGTLLVNIAASATGFVKPVQDSRKELRGFKKDIADLKSSMQSSITSIGAGLAAGLSLGAIGSKILETKREMSSLGLVADKLSMSTERLSELRFAGMMKGLEAGTIDNALMKLQMRISEVAKTGQGDALPTLRELNLEASKLATLTADKQLYEVADALKLVGNGGDRVRLASKLFEEEGVALLNILDKGSAGLRQFAADAQKAGQSIGRDAVDGVRKADEALTQLKASFGGLTNTLLIELSPAATRAIDALNIHSKARPGQRASQTGLAGLYNRFYVDPITNAIARRQAASENRIEAQRPVEGVIQNRWKEFDSVEAIIAKSVAPLLQEKQAKEKATAELMTKQFDGAVVKGINWFWTDAPKKIKTAAESIGEVRDKLEKGMMDFTVESMIRPPGWKADRERRAKERDDARARQQAIESRGLNSAVERDSAEAFRIIASNRVPTLQLDAARKANELLAQIGKNTSNLQLELVGLE